MFAVFILFEYIYILYILILLNTHCARDAELIAISPKLVQPLHVVEAVC